MWKMTVRVAPCKGMVPWLVATIVALSAGAALATDTGSPAGTAGPQRFVAPPEPEPAPKLTPEQRAREQALRERAQERWNAVVDRDFSRAYAFEAPDYRAAHTAKEYARKFGGAVEWHLATVKSVRYDSQDKAMVEVALEVSFPLGMGDEARTEVSLDDTWVFVEGQWWRLDTPQPLGFAPPTQPSRQQ
jgi:hypothetical protein